MSSTVRADFRRVRRDQSQADVHRLLAAEVPLAVEINGIGYAVMMASPADFEDFALGFLLAERLADSAADLEDCITHPMAGGWLLRLTLAADKAGRVQDRVRHRISDSSCGLCGIENLEQALRPLPTVPGAEIADTAIFAALSSLGDHQPLNRKTNAVHVAALCAADGTIRLAREDVGRHNAFDKLIGAMARQELHWNGGFALLSSRCSYELVEKAALAGCPLLATISAPTSLAAQRAKQAGMQLVALARADAILRLT